MKKKTVRVIVVDDEPVIAWTLATILRKEGFATESFTNPLEALESAHGEAPDLLITDVVMPELSGVDLALQMMALWPGCKVLLFSGQAATVDFLGEARRVGQSMQILAKPVHPAELLFAIREQGFEGRFA